MEQPMSPDYQVILDASRDVTDSLTLRLICQPQDRTDVLHQIDEQLRAIDRAHQALRQFGLLAPSEMVSDSEPRERWEHGVHAALANLVQTTRRMVDEVAAAAEPIPVHPQSREDWQRHHEATQAATQARTRWLATLHKIHNGTPGGHGQITRRGLWDLTQQVRRQPPPSPACICCARPVYGGDNPCIDCAVLLAQATAGDPATAGTGHTAANLPARLDLLAALLRRRHGMLTGAGVQAVPWKTPLQAAVPSGIATEQYREWNALPPYTLTLDLPTSPTALLAECCWIRDYLHTEDAGPILLIVARRELRRWYRAMAGMQKPGLPEERDPPANLLDARRALNEIVRWCEGHISRPQDPANLPGQPEAHGDQREAQTEGCALADAAKCSLVEVADNLEGANPPPEQTTPRSSQGSQANPEPLATVAGWPTLRVLAVATEWNSSHGGLSTFNRQLCCALAAAGAEVNCVVLKASEEERRTAQAAGVTLTEAASTPGMPEQSALARKQSLPGGFVPDIIIGHGRVTGPAAQVLERDHFPTAKRLHFIHMAPDEIEWFKLDRGDDAGVRAEERTQIELDIGRTAARVVAVGPRLHQRALNDFHPCGAPDPTRLDPGFDAENLDPRNPPPGQPLKVLVLGRMEDSYLKGLDLAARAVGSAARRRGQSTARIELVVRGAPEGSSEEVRTAVRNWAENPALSVVVRPYTANAERLDADIRRASLVLMPSRTEGFGLVGLEAIVAGTPVLVSDQSGLGAMLQEVLDPEQASRFVVRTSGDDDLDRDEWSRAVDAMLRDREAAFRRAGELRTRLGTVKTWAGAIATLLLDIGGEFARRS
jgi:glycosyltransferase involved in cell wall biosynthesis